MDASQDHAAKNLGDEPSRKKAMLTTLAWAIIQLKKAGHDDAAHFLFYRQFDDGLAPPDMRHEFLSTYESLRRDMGVL